MTIIYLQVLVGPSHTLDLQFQCYRLRVVVIASLYSSSLRRSNTVSATNPCQCCRPGQQPVAYACSTDIVLQGCEQLAE